jgi:hypothetical protein
MYELPILNIQHAKNSHPLAEMMLSTQVVAIYASEGLKRLLR